MSKNLLQIEQLRGGYSEVDIIHGIDLVVESGQIVTIAGTNGAGKSTLVKALLGLLPRVQGSIHLDGRDIARLSAEDRFDAGLAYVPQVANVFPSLTVRENLLVVRGVSHIKRRMDEVLADFPALVERLPQPASDLSGGERQQLAFARALMPSPRIMVLDCRRGRADGGAARAPSAADQSAGLHPGPRALRARWPSTRSAGR
jgi:neutral amino acid transport system ATP-binding protein